MTAALIATTAAAPASADPPNSTDHGIPNQTFHTLWSGDLDSLSASQVNQTNGSAIEQLTNGTDIPLDTPPRAVERWNRGDHREFPTTNASVSIYPPNANRTSRRFITDAYTEVYSVQPSTHARLSPSRQPLYVASNGTVRGTVDYRVAVPPDDTTGNRRVYWTLQRHEINETALRIDGVRESTTGGSHTPALSYTLDGAAGTEHRLTLQATITVQLRKVVETCTVRNAQGGCANWQQTVTNPTETVTVTDSLTVTEYDLSVSGFIGRYSNDDLGLVVYKNQPWLGYELPNGDVRGVWRFYAARDTDWDRLVYRTDGGSQTVHSPLHPLQTSAYPIETGPTPSPRRNVSILDVYGSTTQPPTLPSEVHLDVLTEPYTASYGIAARAKTSQRPGTVRARGLVRGVSATEPASDFARVPIHESNLTVTVLNKTETEVTVRVRLQNASSGAPINTAGRDGYIVLDGQRVNTTGNGTVQTTIDRPSGGVSARYEPGAWWRNVPGYTGDSATVLVQGSILGVVSTLFRIGIPVSLFLLAVFIIDRFTGWRVWPPWRGL